MVTEEVKDAVVEEPKEEVETTNEETNVEEEELSPWYYFFSQGCGWCKKSSPVVEELIDDGHDILLLDLAEPDNQKLSQELKTEYKTSCGTPWFINADTGKQICGFREKDILEKWLAGEDIPAPPRPTGPPPKTPYHGSTNKEDITWKKEYKTWLKDNEHMGEDWTKRQRSANEVIDGPRPKSEAPRPPFGNDVQSVTDEAIDKWGEEMKVWQEENKHLPNLQPVDSMIAQIKNRREQMKKSADGTPTAPSTVGGVVNNVQLNTLDAKVQALEVKLDRIISHFGVK